MTASLRGAMIAFALLVLACASVPPSSQRFVRVETPRFTLVSSLDREDTAQLAMDLESFEAAVDFVLQRPFDPAREGRTLVMAFDDRGPSRRFAARDETAYWIPAVDRPILVFRAPGGWERRARRELIHDYAHRILRARARARLPICLEEGLAQLIGSITRHGSEIRIGAPIPEFIDPLRDWQRSRFDAQIRRVWSPDETSGERLEWSATCWAIAHMEWSASAGRRTALLAAFEETPGDEAIVPSATRAILEREPSRLAEQINEHIARDRFRVDRLQATGGPPDLDRLQPMERADSLLLLGDLASRVDHDSVARRIFEKVLEERPDDEIATIGLARTLRDDPDRARPLLERAASIAAKDAPTALRRGDLWLEEARRASAPADRHRLALRALDDYRLATDQASSSAEALVGQAKALLLSDGDPASAEDALDRASMLRPGALEIDLVRARVAERRGLRRHARLIALDVLSRVHERSLVRDARSLLDSLE